MYLILAIVGLIVPYGFFMAWLSENGLDVPLFFAHLSANGIALFAWLDVAVAAVATVIFILYEGRKKEMQNLWMPIAATLCFGVSCGLPFFLYLREKELKAG
jgi:hypothetical protein